ncbi:MAG: divergent polysaccharide deacetylase family protein [Campylobacterales bacterium]|nr:divergent polysaccharide deacetylase family protein [Campylobacterales bacterium]
MTKRRQTKKNPSAPLLIRYLSFGAIGILILALVGLAGYYAGYEWGKEEAKAQMAQEQERTKKLIEELQNAAELKAQKSRSERLSELLKTHEEAVAPKQQEVMATHEYDNVPPEGPKREPSKKAKTLPKLAIIIDDVAFAHDVAAIKALKIPLTMSFLPPNERHPDSAQLAQRESFYMLHLPLEAMRFSAEERHTLYVKDSQQRISERIAQLRTLFPKATYVNNHTGSRFTANEVAMNRLVFALRQHKMHFIDSRTTAETKVPKVMHNFNLPYIGRDVFLDHVANVSEIKKQIRRAVEIAKQSGSAIAIGHPRKETLQALRDSSAMLREVELVRIDDYM